ncbi:MAG: GTP-binding protein [Nannocystaceae bacterium]
MSEEAAPQADAAARLPTLTVATIGHVRSGKTSVIAALTLVAARLPGYDASFRSVRELDRRGGSTDLRPIDDEELAAALRDDRRPRMESVTVRGAKEPLLLPSRRVVAVDCPGVRGWLKNVARGVAASDALLLVVSAMESVENQTAEHLHLARALGHEQVVVFINKCDEVFDLEWLDLVERDVRELLDRCGFDGDATRILRGAAGRVLAGDDAWEPSVRDLLGALETDLELPRWSDEGELLIYLDRVFRRRIANKRVLVEGRVRRGSLAVGETVFACGLGLASNVVVGSLENYHRRIERASAGDQIGMLLYRPDGQLYPALLRSSQSLVALRATGGPPMTRVIEVDIDLLGVAENGRTTPLRDGHDLFCIFGSAVCSGVLSLEGRPPIAPGEGGRARIALRGELYLEPGMRFAVRDGNQGPWGTKEPRRARWGGLAGSGTIVAVAPA